MGSKVYSVRVPEDLALDIDNHCAEQGITPAEMLRKLVKNHVHPTELSDEQWEGKPLVNMETKSNQPEQTEATMEPTERQDLAAAMEDIQISVGAIQEELNGLTESVDDLYQRVNALEASQQGTQEGDVDADTDTKPATEEQSLFDVLFNKE